MPKERRAVLGGQSRRVGWVRYDHPDLFEAIHVADSLLRSPVSFAHFIEAASSDVLARAGKLLSRRLFPESEKERDNAPGRASSVCP